MNDEPDNILTDDNSQNVVRIDSHPSFLSTEDDVTVLAPVYTNDHAVVSEGSESFVSCPSDHVVVSTGEGRTFLEGGGGTASFTFQAVAGEPLGGHRAVYIANDGKAYVCRSTDLVTRNCVGLTTSSVLSGVVFDVTFDGEVSEPSWTWTPGEPVYVGPTGLLTQSPPATGYSLLFGFALTAQKIIITLEDSVELAS